MSRLRSNCSVIWLMPNELDDVIVCKRRDLAELPLQRRGHQRGDGVGVGARQLGGDLDGRKIDLRQRGNRQPPVTEPAAQHHRDAKQRGGDRPVDEGRGDAHCCGFGLVLDRRAAAAARRFVASGVDRAAVHFESALQCPHCPS